MYFDNITLLRYIDVIVDGKFIIDKKDISLKFRGSSNQRIIDVKASLNSKSIVLKYGYMDEKINIAR